MGIVDVKALEALDRPAKGRAGGEEVEPVGEPSPVRAGSGRLAGTNPTLPEAFMNLDLHLTAVFLKRPAGYVAFVEELPGANTQGATLEEARQNLREAIILVMEANRELAEDSIAGQEVIREPLVLSAA